MQANSLGPSQRLPVNPRRHKVAPELRKRVARACNGCNVRRIKCSGEQPCQPCRVATRECLYPPVEANKDASSLKNEIEKLRKKCTALEKGLQAVVPDDAAREQLLQQLDRGEPIARTSLPTFHLESSDIDDVEGEGRLLFDPDGNVRFLGETSGATFLDLLKQFMLTLIPLSSGLAGTEDGSVFIASIGQYQTFDSRPLLDPDVDPLWLPTRTEMTLMLAELRYYIQDGSGDFPSGGIHWWGDLSNVPVAMPISSPQSNTRIDETYRHLAFYHVSFALASQVAHPPARHSEQHTGEVYFKRARILLGNPLDTVRFTLSDVPVLAMMGFYLIELNRRDAAYMYVSLAIHIATMHGAFRHCVDEASKRTFWTLYILDRWLSCLMGRPPTIMDEAIRLPLPSDDPSMPPSAGLRAHVELARISSHIVCETYRVASRKHRAGQVADNIDKAIKLLQDWLMQLPSSLQMPPNQYSIDPACCTLHMAHNQLILLTTRPIFFIAVKRSVAERYVLSDQWQVKQHPQLMHIQSCSAAAHRNIHLAQWLVQLNNAKRLLQAGLHFAFNAAVILILDRLLCSHTGATDNEINFVIHVFEEESKTGSNYARDCSRVLQDLNALVTRFLSTERMGYYQQDYVPVPEDVPPVIQNSIQTIDYVVEAPVAQGRLGQINEGDDLYQELMGWMQTDESQLHGTFRI